MSRRRPLCAWCGERLTVRRSGLTIQNEYGDLPGAPAVGWHSDATMSPESCAGADPLGAAGLLRREEPRSRPVPWALTEIEQRGEGRVVRRRR